MSIQSGYGEFGNDIPDGRKFLIRLIKPISANLAPFGTFWENGSLDLAKIWTQGGRQIGGTYGLYHIFEKILNQAN